MGKNFKILLFYPNEYLVGVAPSNMAILSACLKQDNFDVKLFDCTMYKNTTDETQDDVRSKFGQVMKADINNYVKAKNVDIYEDFIHIVEEYKPNLIGFNVIDSTIKYAFSFIEKIKHKKIPIITGGVGSTFNYEKILNSNLVDYVCIGEGEGALVELCNKLMNNEDCTKIQNLCFKDKDGNIIKNPKRKRANLNELPIPDFSIYEYDRFYRPFMGTVVRMAQIDLDRGCPFSCTYCAAPALKEEFKKDNCGTYYRIKNLDKIFEEIKDLINKYDINFLWISSETLLALPLAKFKEFAERYKKEINLPFWSQNRLDMFSEEKTRLLAEMGCQAVSVGLEHGSEKIRKQLLDKHISNKKILESSKILAKYNITVTLNNMVGLPDETRENIFETIDLNRKISKILKGNHTLNVFTFIPFAGTKLREICIEKNYISKDFDIPFSYQKESILNMPSLSKEEIYGLEKTFAMYVLLPELYWPKIKIAEQDNKEGIQMFNDLSEILDHINDEEKTPAEEFTEVYNKEKFINNLRNDINKKDFDEYRKIWDKASNLEIIPEFPPQLDFELNYSCNFSCITCTWNIESKIKDKDTWFPFSVYKEIIDYSIPKGLKAIRLNYLNEPLMRKDINKFIKYAKDAGILDIYFSTNGSLLTEKISRELIEAGLSRIQISIDAYTKDTYDKIRKGGNFNQIKKNIEKFIEIKRGMDVTLPTIRVNFVKTDDNEHELEDFVKYWETKVESIGIQSYINILGYEKAEYVRKKFKCNQPFLHLTIRYDGTILPCCTFFGAEIPIAMLKTSIPLSNIPNVGLKNETRTKLILKNIEESWNSKEINVLRKLHKNGEYWKNPVCKKCVET